MRPPTSSTSTSIRFFHSTVGRKGAIPCLYRDDPSPSPSSSNGVPLFSFSLLHTLIHRGLLPNAHRMLLQIVTQTSSANHILAAIDLFFLNGIQLHLSTYSLLFRRFLQLGHFTIVHSIYNQHLLSTPIPPDSSILNSLVISLCRSGELNHALKHFDSILSSSSHPSKTASNLVIKCLCSRGRELDSFLYFTKIRAIGMVLDVFCCKALIRGLSFRGYLDEALEVFDEMHRPRDPGLYTTLVRGLCWRGRVVEAEALCCSMEADGVYPERVVYTWIVNGYCKSGKMKMAMRVFFRMVRRGLHPDECTYNTIIHGFFKTGSADKGWVLYNMMVDGGILPTNVTYHLIISGYCRAGKTDQALTLFNVLIGSGFNPTVHFYTVLIAALRRDDRIEEVEKLYLHMLGNGVYPDHVLFLTLISGLPKGVELHVAVVMLRAIAGCGVGSIPSHHTPFSHHPEVVSELECEIEFLIEEIARNGKCPLTVPYGILVSAFSAMGEVENAIMCMARMHSLGLTPLVSSYNSVIRCLYRRGDVEGASCLMGVICENGLVPNEATYLVMVDGHCKCRDSVMAVGVLDRMDEVGLKPGVAIYDTIIGLLCREKRIVEAEHLFRRMLERGGFPDERLFTTMINGYLVNGRIVKACELFEKMREHGVESNLQAYTAMIIGLVRKNMVGKGCFYLSRMLEDGFQPNTVLYTSLIQQFLRKGEVEFVFRLVDLMETGVIRQDVITYLVLVCGVCRNIIPIVENRPLLCNQGYLEEKNRLLYLLIENCRLTDMKMADIHTRSAEDVKKAAVKLIEMARFSIFMPNLYIYNSLMFGLCQVGKMEEAYGYFNQLLMDGLYPNHVTLTILMCGEISYGDIDRAIWLYVSMNRDGHCTADRIAYNTLMSGLCRYRRLSDALTLWPGMRKRGIYPNRYASENMLDCFICNNMSREAFRFYEEMVDRGCFPHGRSLSVLFCVLYTENRLKEAHAVLDTVDRSGKLLDKFVRPFLEAHHRTM